MVSLRRREHILSTAEPPPSPIATGKGTKSAAVDDRVLSEYLGKTLQVPELSLPQATVSRLSVIEIDFSSLVSRNEEALSKMLRSVMEFGLFGIIGHGILIEELFEETDDVLGDSLGKQKVWFRNGKVIDENLERGIGSKRYQRLRQKLKEIHDKLEIVTCNVGQILSEHLNHLDKERIQERESVLCLEKNDMGDQRDKDVHGSKHALNLYLTNNDQELRIQSLRGLLSFTMHKGTVLVILRQHLKDWSERKFKSILGQPIFEPVRGGKASYLIKFMSSPPTLTNDLNKTSKIITLHDQIFIAIILFTLYNLFNYISSIFTLT